jgi:3-hydroxyisobutyrate dehydrogenase
MELIKIELRATARTYQRRAEMDDRPRVAVVGTGLMGGAMAGRLLANQFPVTVWNRRREKAAQLEPAGAVVASSPEEAVSDANVIITMLSDGSVTQAVMSDAVGLMPEGSIWLQMGTVGADATEQLADLAAKAGVAFVDAPVLGTKQPAEQGTLTVFASGPEEVRERCQPIFEAVASKVMWVGDVGAGSRLKIVVNAWLTALVAGLAEAIALAEATGVDPRQLLAAIEGGPVGPAYAQVKGKMMIERSYPASFPLRLFVETVDLIEAAAGQAGVNLRLPAAVRAHLRAALEHHGDEDMSAMVEALRDRRRTS